MVWPVRPRVRSRARDDAMRVDHGSLASMRALFRRALSSVIGLLSMRGFVVARWTGTSHDTGPLGMIVPGCEERASSQQV